MRSRDPQTPDYRARRFAVWVCLVLLLGLTGCGDGREIDPVAETERLLAELLLIWDSDEEVERSKLLSAIGALGQAHGDVVVPLLIERLKSEKRNANLSTVVVRIDLSGSNLDLKKRKERARVARDVMVRRFREHFPRLQVNANFTPPSEELPAVIEFGIVRVHEDDQKEAGILALVMDVLTRPGSIHLLPVVTRPTAGADGPASLWKGDAASFDAFVAKHEPLVREAVANGRRGLLGDGAFRLVLRSGDTPERKLDPVVVLQPTSAAETFTQSEITLDGKFVPETRTNVLQIAVSPARTEDFDAFCKTHAGRELGFLVDGQVELVIPTPKDAAQMRFISIGKAGSVHADGGPRVPSASDRQLFRVVKSTRPGYIPYPMTAEVLGNEPTRMLTAITASLVSVGRSVEPYLAPIQELGGNIAQRARWVRGEIRRLERGGGR